MNTWWIWVIIAYLAGSIPVGLLISRARGIDIRSHGSGNIGSTNVGRVMGKKWGGLCFILDVVKGFVPVLAAGMALGLAGQWDLTTAQASRWLAVAMAAVLGHMFPLWLGFKGGKGVATGLGVLLGFWPILTLTGLAGFITWILLASMFRYVSVASILASMSLSVYLAVCAVITRTPLANLWPFFIVTGLMALLVLLRHIPNIKRLVAGTESRLGRR